MKLSQRDKEEIVVAINAEKTTKELAFTYGVSSTHIRDIYREITGKRVKRIGRLSQQDKEAIVTALHSGKATMKDLSITYKVAQTTISHTFKQVTGHYFRPPRLSQMQKAAIVAELQSGRTAKELYLTGKYKVNISRICQIYKAATGKGLKIYKLSQQDKEAIVTALHSGKTPTDLSDIYGVSSSYIGTVYEKVTGNTWRSHKKYYP
jgi:hypothetical protein